MLRFTKQAEPEALGRWRSTPGATWDAVDGGTKSQVRRQLCREQGGLCAYCQRRLRPDEARDGVPTTRVEHWEPRSGGEMQLTWSNLLAVCVGVTEGARHCDAARGDRALFLHPVEGRGPDPRPLLRYLGDGSVDTDDERAAKDVATLGLNAEILRLNRAKAIDALHARLVRTGWSEGALRAELKRLDDRFVAGEAPEYVEVARYHLRRWLRKRST